MADWLNLSWSDGPNCGSNEKKINDITTLLTFAMKEKYESVRFASPVDALGQLGNLCKAKVDS
jgi:hypothetical protein